MSRLVFRNATGYPDDEVERLIRFALDDLDFPSPWSIVIRIAYTRVSRRQRLPDGRARYGASGYARDWVALAPDVPDGAGWEIVLRVGKPGDFPTAWWDRYRLGLGTIADWREALVAVAAHEGKHIESYQHGIGGRRTISGRAEEARCDAYALARIRAFRAADECATVVA